MWCFLVGFGASISRPLLYFLLGLLLAPSYWPILWFVLILFLGYFYLLGFDGLWWCHLHILLCLLFVSGLDPLSWCWITKDFNLNLVVVLLLFSLQQTCFILLFDKICRLRSYESIWVGCQLFPVLLLFIFASW